MGKNYQNTTPEVVFGSSEPAESRRVAKLEREGKLRKLGSRLYTLNLEDHPDEIIRRNIFLILGKMYPGAVLSHRSALEFAPTETGHMFLTYSYTRNVKLGGLTLHFLKGKPAHAQDNPLMGELYCAQLERTLLENMQQVRKDGPEAKCVQTEVLEEKLEEIIRTRGEDGLNAVRDRARKLARELEMENEFDRLEKRIGAMLTTRSMAVLKSPVAIARATRQPYDASRIDLFNTLYVALQQLVYPDRPDPNLAPDPYRHFAFYEAYFSNYIEGTRFEVYEALEIIESGRAMPARREDSHDILGTYRIVADREEMRIVPENPEHMMSLMRARHKVLLSSRNTMQPGIFKDLNNRAGDTVFVDHALVNGTLTKAYEYYTMLREPIARAIYMMFIISEIHPFLDGNGRIARVMMNAELVKAGQTRIIIPNVYREDYVLALRKLTRAQDPAPFIRMMLRAQEFSYGLRGRVRQDYDRLLLLSDAFREPEAGRLRIPGKDFPWDA